VIDDRLAAELERIGVEDAVAAARARFTGTNRGSGGWRPSMSDLGPTGKRQRRWVSEKTKTEAKQRSLALRRDQSDGLPTELRTYTVREAVESWLEHGLTGRDDHTVTNRTILAKTHVIPALGAAVS
jgi:hypothetical protein